jgi:integrase
MRMGVITSERGLRSLPDGEHKDSMVPSLFLRVRGDRRVWNVRTNGKRHTLQPPYPVLGLADARDRARELLLALERGGGTAAADDVAAGVELYLADVRKRAKDPEQVDWLLKRYVIPAIGKVKLDRLHRRDVQGMIDSIEKPATAGRVAAMTAALWNWLHARGHLDQAAPRFVKPKTNGPRERVLTRDEIRAIWNACEGREPAGRVLRVLLLTGCRREEIAGLRETEVVDGVLRIPGERTKSGRPHVLPLPPLALKLIEESPHDGELIFPGRAGTFKGWSRAVDDIQRISKTSGWTPHDLRRTCASGLVAPPHIIDRVLNHAAPKLRQTYQRQDYAAEVLAALSAWEKAVVDVVEKKP